MKNNTPTQKPSLTLFSKIFRFAFYFFLISILLTVVGGTALYYYFSRDLPKLSKIDDYHPNLVTEIFDDTGKEVGEFWSECRFLTPIKDIPDKLIKGFVASEDERFFAHHGVDFWGIFRAFINNLKAGQVVQGGSTITQQVTKSLVLSPERTYDRKIKEAILATEIEKNLSKDQILYLYLNHIFFGNRAYGVAAAARNYFHKDLKELNIAEIAMIVGLSKAPSAYNPLTNPERAKSRQHYVIDRMREQGYITKKEAEEAKATQLKVYKAGTDKDFNLEYTPYFTEHIRRYLVDKYGEDALYHGGWKVYATVNLDMQKAGQSAVDRGLREVDKQKGYRGPLQNLSDKTAIEKFNTQNHIKILEATPNIDYGQYHTTQSLLNIKTPLQEDKYYNGVIVGGSRSSGFEVMVGNVRGTIASETMTWAAAASNLKNGDVVEVRLYHPSVTPDAKSKKGKPIVENKSIPTDFSQPLFALTQEPNLQSALYSYEPFTGEVKAIVGGLDYRKSEFNRATQALRQPGSSIKPLIYSAALDKGYTPNTVIMDSPIVYEESPGKFWTPKNYGGGYSGPTPLRSALVHSRNVVTVRIVMDIGTHYIDAYMRKLGLTSPIQKYYSMALGANDVYLAELARAYGTFATGGILPETYFIRKIVDPSGKVIEENKPMEKKFIITWDAPKGSESASPNVPGERSSKGEEAEGHAKIPESQHASSESHSSPESRAENSETKPNSKKDPKTVKAIPWDEMEYSSILEKVGDEVIQKDQLNLSEYEKKILYGNYIPPDHVITPRTAATMVSLMEDVVKYGTGTKALELKKPAAGKTGTTNNATDAWFIGYTPTLVTGVWVGHDEKSKTIGHNATGGHVAAPIWLYYMTEATKKYPTKEFKLPPWLDLSQYQTPMEIVKGDTESIDYGGGIPGTGNGEKKDGGGADFWEKDL